MVSHVKVNEGVVEDSSNCLKVRLKEKVNDAQDHTLPILEVNTSSATIPVVTSTAIEIDTRYNLDNTT